MTKKEVRRRLLSYRDQILSLTPDITETPTDTFPKIVKAFSLMASSIEALIPVEEVAAPEAQPSAKIFSAFREARIWMRTRESIVLEAVRRSLKDAMDADPYRKVVVASTPTPYRGIAIVFEGETYIVRVEAT